MLRLDHYMDDNDSPWRRRISSTNHMDFFGVEVVKWLVITPPSCFRFLDFLERCVRTPVN